MVNAYAILANQGRSLKPTTIDYIEDRNGKVIWRADNRCALMGNATRPTGTAGRCRGRRAGPGRWSTPMAAFQMVHIMEGVVQRGTATVLRDLDRPLFGKTGTTNGPTNVWFVGGTPRGRRRRLSRLRPAAADGRLCAGRPHRGADLEAMGADRAQGPAEGSVRRAAGNPLGPDRPRDAASPCSAPVRRRKTPSRR